MKLNRLFTVILGKMQAKINQNFKLQSKNPGREELKYISKEEENIFSWVLKRVNEMESTGRLLQKADGQWEEVQSCPDAVLAVTSIEGVGTGVEAQKLQ